MNLLVAFIGGGAGALVAGIFALINRHLDKKDQKQSFKSQLQKLEKDSVRTQLLVLISDYPEDKAEILECARHYFSDLHGDWYMTPIFNRWLAKEQIGKPEWFNPQK